MPGDVAVRPAARYTITHERGIDHCLRSGPVVIDNGRIDACQGLMLATREHPHPFAPAAERPASFSFMVYVVKRGASGVQPVPAPPR